MRTIEQFEAEVFSAVEHKKRKAKKQKRTVTALALCLCVCLTVSVFAFPLIKDTGISPDNISDEEAPPGTSDNAAPVQDDTDEDDTLKGSTSGNGSMNDASANQMYPNETKNESGLKSNTIHAPKYIINEVYGMFFDDGLEPLCFEVVSDGSKYSFTFSFEENTKKIEKPFSELTSAEAERIKEIVGF